MRDPARELAEAFQPLGQLQLRLLPVCPFLRFPHFVALGA